MKKIRGRKQRKELSGTIEKGRKLLVAQQEQEAVEFLGGAVQRFPDDPEIRVLYASILLAFRPEDVAVEATKAAELGPDDPVILVRAAYLVLDRGKVELARSYAARTKELVSPEFLFYPELLCLEGRLAALDGNDDLAEERMRLALEREPSGETLSVALAKFLANRDRQAEALEVIDEALERTSQKAKLKRHRAEIAGEEISSD